MLSQPSLLLSTTRLLDYIGNNPAKSGLFLTLLKDHYTGIKYTLTQSDSQAVVGSIQQFLDMSGPCSIFIGGIINNAFQLIG